MSLLLGPIVIKVRCGGEGIGVGVERVIAAEPLATLAPLAPEVGLRLGIGLEMAWQQVFLGSRNHE